MQPSTRIILFVIDGLRPDALQQAYTPEIDELIARGSFTLRARSVEPSITLPCHVSMFFGVPPTRHGVLDNVWLSPPSPTQSLFEVAHRANLTTAAFYSWEPLRDLAPPGTLDMAYFRRYDSPQGDAEMEIAIAAAEYVARERPALTFVYLGATDEIAHDHGWMSEAYLRAVSRADGIVGLVLRSSRISGNVADTVCLLTADHGGHDFGHSAGEPADLTIPWLVSGPGIRQGHQIASSISIVDTAPTVAHVLGLPIPPQWTGKAVTEILIR